MLYTGDQNLILLSSFFQSQLKKTTFTRNVINDNTIAESFMLIMLKNNMFSLNNVL